MTQQYIREFFAHRCKQLRITESLTHEKFFEDTRLNSTRLENKTKNHKLDTLARICKYYHITPLQFFITYTAFVKNKENMATNQDNV